RGARVSRSAAGGAAAARERAERRRLPDSGGTLAREHRAAGTRFSRPRGARSAARAGPLPDRRRRAPRHRAGDTSMSQTSDTAANALRVHAEEQFEAELAELARVDVRPRPPSWTLSPWAVRSSLIGPN